jgi:hypothetical protein
MIKKKGRFYVVGLTFLVSLSSAGALYAMNNAGNSILMAEPGSFAIAFGNATNKLVTEPLSPGQYYSGTNEAITALNSSITFQYVDFANATSAWQTIKLGGYLANMDALHGIRSLTIATSIPDANVGLYWSNFNLFTDTQYEALNADSNLIIKDFSTNRPNFVKLVALDDDLIIEDIEIVYSCADEDPVVGGGVQSFQMGSYPQTEVTDEGLVATLNTEAGDLPSSTDRKDWVAYDFYVSNSNETEYMWYQDVVNNGVKYRGVYFTNYRLRNPMEPYDLSGPYIDYYTAQPANGYEILNTYWFKFEPITWDLLSVNELQGPLLVSHSVLDSHDYHHDDYQVSPWDPYFPEEDPPVEEETGNANDYSASDIRSWLNNEFYSWAFSTFEKSMITTTLVDNSQASTENRYGLSHYFCDDTNDKVFLLSSKDIVNSSYGFSTEYTSSNTRQKIGTDYAKAMGSQDHSVSDSSIYANWWLRSPHNFEYSVGQVSFDGGAYDYQVNDTTYGVVPAIRLDINN